MKEKAGAKNFFQELVKSRRSIRRYLDEPVEREKILTCIEAARLAPSADNVPVSYTHLTLPTSDLV